MDNDNQLHANGKLLISGEYLVLTGANALAFPVRFGQSIQIIQNENKLLNWTSVDSSATWFSGEFEPETIKSLRTTDKRISDYLTKLLKAARRLNPLFLADPNGVIVTVKANYPLEWGLGSSSTLIALVAGWAGVDKFKLFGMISKGSGYDVACADKESLIIFQLCDGKGFITPLQPGKALLNHTCFAYLGRKQESDSEVSSFLSRRNYSQSDVDRISEISLLICKSDDPSLLCSLVDEHEEILSRILKKERIAKRFPGFPGSIKSLGAWGGDFAMFVSPMKNHEIKNWLEQAGFDVIFTFNELKIPAAES